MWSATYQTVDIGGLNPELKITVVYLNDQDDVTYEVTYSVLPDTLEGDFAVIVQNQIDILNSKYAIQKTILNSLVNTPIISNQNSIKL